VPVESKKANSQKSKFSDAIWLMSVVPSRLGVLFLEFAGTSKPSITGPEAIQCDYSSLAGFCHLNRQTPRLLEVFVNCMLRKVSYLRFPGAKLNDYLDQAVRLFDYVQHNKAYQGSRSSTGSSHS
jgi:hypothetical protein